MYLRRFYLRWVSKQRHIVDLHFSNLQKSPHFPKQLSFEAYYNCTERLISQGIYFHDTESFLATYLLRNNYMSLLSLVCEISTRMGSCCYTLRYMFRYIINYHVNVEKTWKVVYQSRRFVIEAVCTTGWTCFMEWSNKQWSNKQWATQTMIKTNNDQVCDLIIN